MFGNDASAVTGLDGIFVINDRAARARVCLPTREPNVRFVRKLLMGASRSAHCARTTLSEASISAVSKRAQQAKGPAVYIPALVRLSQRGALPELLKDPIPSRVSVLPNRERNSRNLAFRETRAVPHDALKP